MKIFVHVLFDSITNAVFSGQVYEPIMQHLAQDQNVHVYVVSFEPHNLLHAARKRLHMIQKHARLHIILKWRLPFFTKICLLLPILRLRCLLKNFARYELIARGPLACVICQKALDAQRCKRLTVQARGLLAQEYRYAHACASGLPKLFYDWRTRCYEYIERCAYTRTQPCFYMIQVVSHALADYLKQNFNVDDQKIELAVHDVPALVDATRRQTWRARRRAQLNIALDATVYCFCGAAHSWQMPGMTVDYFCQHYARNKKSFLLILSKDVDVFVPLLAKRVPENSYKIMSVVHEKVFEYLCAADIGIIFRESSVINWVSRPVKAMEYEAAGLSIAHNNTVAWIVARYGINRARSVFQKALV